MKYRVVVTGETEHIVHPVTTEKLAFDLFNRLNGRGIPWGEAHVVAIQVSKDGVEWRTVVGRERRVGDERPGYRVVVVWRGMERVLVGAKEWSVGKDLLDDFASAEWSDFDAMALQESSDGRDWVDIDRRTRPSENLAERFRNGPKQGGRMQYRVAVINLEGDVAADPAETYDDAKRLFDFVRTLPWGPAVALAIQCSADAETWTTIRRIDRDAVENEALTKGADT